MKEEDQYDEGYDKDQVNTDLTKLIEEALSNSIINQKEYKTRQELSDVVKSLVAEYLDSFIILGYDFDGSIVDIQASTSSQQKDALSTLILKYLYLKTGQTIPGMYKDDETF
tara:strand:+ start:1274 stop:1609 length:336 start_codon:yes stop_codon:yes gene_type:complete